MSGWSRLAALAFAIVVGTISDRTTGQPLGGVTVSSGAAHAVSHADGSFRFVVPKAGRIVVSVSSDDVPPQQFPVTAGSKTPARLRVCSTTLDYNCGPPQ